MKLEDIKKIGVENCEKVYFQRFKAAVEVSIDLIIKTLTTGITKNDIEKYEMKLKESNFENIEVKENEQTN